MSTAPALPADGRLLRWHDHGRDRLLVCLHHAGGGAASFAAWPRQLADCADLALVQLPGREDRLDEPLQEALPDLARRLAAALAGADREHLVLLGHSMGATIAWWVAAELWRTHGQRAAVVVSSRAPLAPVPAAWNPASSLDDWFRLLGEAPPQALALPELQQLLRQTLDQDMAWMRREFDRELPGPLPVDLTCLCAQDDQLATCAQMSDWRRFTTGAFQVHRLPGGHLHLLNRPHAVIRVIRELLEGARPTCWTN
jgi:surfactin synthase thioesterase subunit